MTWPIFHPLANRDRRNGTPCSYVIEHRRKSGRCKTRSREFCCLAACVCVRDNCIAELRALSNKTAAEFRKSIWLSGSSKLESESQDKEIKTGLDYMRAIEFKRESARSYNGPAFPGAKPATTDRRLASHPTRHALHECRDTRRTRQKRPFSRRFRIQLSPPAATIANARAPSRWAASSAEKISSLNAINLKPHPVERGIVMPQCQPPSCSNTWRTAGGWPGGGAEVVMACSPVMERPRGNCFERTSPVYGCLCCAAILRSLQKIPIDDTSQF